MQIPAAVAASPRGWPLACRAGGSGHTRCGRCVAGTCTWRASPCDSWCPFQRQKPLAARSNQASLLACLGSGPGRSRADPLMGPWMMPCLGWPTLRAEDLSSCSTKRQPPSGSGDGIDVPRSLAMGRGSWGWRLRSQTFCLGLLKQAGCRTALAWVGRWSDASGPPAACGDLLLGSAAEAWALRLKRRQACSAA